VTAEIVTFGCRLNAAESDAIAARAAADRVGDVVVFNTCAVTAEAVRQARQAIRKTAREQPGARLIVTGCASQIDPAAFAALPGVDLVLGNSEKSAPGRLLMSGVHVGDIMGAPAPPSESVGMSSERARAYVEIQNGCDHRCTFCVIPFGRGNSRSICADVVVERVRALAARHAEVVLTGVDLTSWGSDLPGGPSLGSLVAAVLAQVPELPRLRLSSIDAAEIDGDLLAVLARDTRLMPHLHLSLQSGDDLILKRMKRRHSRGQALAMIEAVRAVRPDVAFGADFIAGFPTESDAAFENTLAFVAEAGLAYLHVFPYSARPGTPAARMPRLESAVVKARATRLRAAGAEALARHLDRAVGRAPPARGGGPGRAPPEDFTEIAFTGEAGAGSLITGLLAGHDGRRARLDDWRMAA
jgi:threonylcarbamoyladenosine tRNA methylthiotransferase MtaB